MGEVRNLKRLRGRTPEEQMLGVLAVAGVAFAVVSLVAFFRPGGSGPTASARPPESRAPVHSQPPSSTSTSESGASSVDNAGAPAPAAVQAPAPVGTVAQQLQSLFASVLTPRQTTSAVVGPTSTTALTRAN